MLDILRIVTLILCFLYVGFNLSIYKNKKNTISSAVLFGRITLVVGIACGVFLRLINHPLLAGYIGNILIITGLTLSTIGLYNRYIKPKERHE